MKDVVLVEEEMHTETASVAAIMQEERKKQLKPKGRRKRIT